MKYLLLSPADRSQLIAGLEKMPDFLEQTFCLLTPAEAARPLEQGAFAPVEQCWHLADLEREGFGARIIRLLNEPAPQLPDFDGARVASERHYRARSLPEGIAAFRAARHANLALLRSVAEASWNRSGEQEGVGPVMLCDLPVMMAEHDAAHRAEIAQWQQAWAS